MKKFMFVAAIAALTLSSCEKKSEMPVKENTSAKTEAPEALNTAPIVSETPQKQTTEKPKTEYVKNANYFSLPGMDGKNVDLKDYAGQPVLVMFFTENCPFCKKAAPFVNKMHEKYSSQGLAVLGISTKDYIESPKKFSEEFKIKYPLAYKGKSVSVDYHIQGVPTLFLLDKNHNNYDMWIGFDSSYEPDIDVTIGHVL